MTPQISLGSRLDYRPIVDHPSFLWPNDAGVAVWVVPNVEYYPPDLPGAAVNDRSAAAQPDILNHSWREYGPRVGFWRLLACFDELDVKISATLNSDVCRHYPRLVEEGIRRGWEWIGHGQHNAERLSGLSETDEKNLIETSLVTVTESTGRRPHGWLGPGLGESGNTLDVLSGLGIDYVCDWVADDLPFFLETSHGRLLSLPYSIELNDMELILRQRLTGPEYRQRILDQFDQLCREARRDDRGRVMAIPLHPFLAGQAHRIGYLSDALAAIASSDQSWLALGAEIADHYCALAHEGQAKEGRS